MELHREQAKSEGRRHLHAWMRWNNFLRLFTKCRALSKILTHAGRSVVYSDFQSFQWLPDRCFSMGCRPGLQASGPLQKGFFPKGRVNHREYLYSCPHVKESFLRNDVCLRLLATLFSESWQNIGFIYNFIFPHRAALQSGPHFLRFPFSR